MRTITSLIVGAGLISFAGQSSSAPLLFPSPIFETGTNPFSVAVGDFNGDGKPDLVLANFNSGTVSVMLASGGGAYAGHTQYSTGTNPACVIAKDLNGDAKLDLAVANYGSGTISILLGNGNGTFSSQATYATGVTPYAVSSEDLNGDGKSDLAVANVGSNSVSVLLGNGNGTFAPQTQFGTGAQPDRDPAFIGPGIESAASELRAVVAHDAFGIAAVEPDLVEKLDHP